MDIKNKTILITGASSGIGKATAIALAKEGANVIINYNTNENTAKEVLTECNKFSKNNSLVQANITQESQVEKMFKKIAKDYKQLDILINNSGIYDSTDSVINMNAFDNIYQTNFLAQIRVIKHALGILKKGKIINVSSIHGRLGHGRPKAAAYSSMKAALNNYTKNLAKELAPHILVNAVAPGKTLTPMWGDLTREEQKQLSQDQLIKRFILPEEVADAILFLLKNDAMCGEILTIDGGMSLKTLN